MLFINNLTKNKIDRKFLHSVEKKAAENVFGSSKAKKTEIDLAIVGERRMQKLNYRWRGKDKTTDVLSFGNDNKEKTFGFIAAPDHIRHLGEIFICRSVALRQARRYGCSLNEEMARLLVHGILHLAGYDHEKEEKEKKKMLVLQEKILRKIAGKRA